MTYEINETHDPNLKSWVESANDPNTDFPIQNLPFCEFIRPGDYIQGSTDEEWQLGVAIGNQIFGIRDAYVRNLFPKHWGTGIDPFVLNSVSGVMMYGGSTPLRHA